MAKTPRRTRAAHTQRVVERARVEFEGKITTAAHRLLALTVDSDKGLKAIATETLQALLRLSGSAATSGKIARLKGLLVATEASIKCSDAPDEPATSEGHTDATSK
jgi:hypothetical protein